LIFLIFWYVWKTISIDKLCPQSVLKHSVVHSQGIGMKFESFFFVFFKPNMLKNEISIHKFNPQWGLKHSVGHSQGIGIKFESFFFSISFWPKLCPQSGLKHSVVHFQGIGMKI